MLEFVDLEGVQIEVTRKNIKNLHLSIKPPEGSLKITAPYFMSLEHIQNFVVSKKNWINKNQQRFQSVEPQVKLEFKDHDEVYAFGNLISLRVVETSKPLQVIFEPPCLILYVHKNTSLVKREALVLAWYKQILKAQIVLLIQKWEPILKVKVKEVFIQQMKTRWGTCNTRTHGIRINLELAKKTPACLEYVVVHEMAHLLVRNHGPKFKAVLDKALPEWKKIHSFLRKYPGLHQVKEV